jgi:Na+/melibiose symporter-like transporter
MSASPDAVGGAAPLPIGQRTRLLGYAAVPLLLLSFAAPFNGFINIPVLFFLRNRLHLSAPEAAQFAILTGIPLFLGFLFGFARDRWSPFGAGDRGHLAVFGGATALIYAAMAFLPPTYAVLAIGVLLATATIQFVSGAANGLASEVSRRHGMTGQMSMVLGIAVVLPTALAYAFGGTLSGLLERADASAAARTLFLSAAGIMAVLAAFALFGPRRLFEDGQAEPQGLTPLADLKRLARHWPIYPALIIQLLWQFAPAAGAALVYHLAGDLHATDAEVGFFFAIFFASFIPVFLLYGWLAQRLSLRTLLWVGALLAIPQMAPLFFVQTPQQALIAALGFGIMGGIGQGAFQDLTMRSCPKGLEGTMMMLWWACYWISLRGGDLWGADLYEHHGGFDTAIWATIGVYALIAPVLLLIPRSVTAKPDAHA